MATGRINKRTVDALKAGDRDQFLWDEELRGFGIKVTPLGVKSYLLQYRMGGREAATRRYTIGRHGSPWSPDSARDRAKVVLEQARSGKDPQLHERAQRRAAVDLAFDTYLERFLSQYGRAHWRDGTYASAASNLRRLVVPVLSKKPLPQIDRRDLTAVFDALPKGKPALPRTYFRTYAECLAGRQNAAISKGRLLRE